MKAWRYQQSDLALFHHRPNLERQSNRNSSEAGGSAIVKSPFDLVSLSEDSSGEITVINR
jgi:hypothetical protein